MGNGSENVAQILGHKVQNLKKRAFSDGHYLHPEGWMDEVS